MTLSRRICDELGCHNQEVSYKVRFDTPSNSHTRLLFLTDGALLQELYSSPLLDNYSVVMLDDVHERSLNYDILLGLLKKILLVRNDLKVVITSATADTARILQFFEKPTLNGRKISVKRVDITGRLHQVKLHYLRESTSNYFLKAFQTIVYIDRQKPHGDVLVFLPSV